MNSKQKFEKERLDATQPYVFLDENDELNRLVKLASQICETEISLVTLLDKDVQWFKAKHGIELKQTPREVAFCNYAIESTEMLEVEDASQDQRFANNPLVTDDPNVRFYAGMPIINYQGYPLGTLCVIDSKPKKLSDKQKKALSGIAALVKSCLDKSVKEPKRKEQNLESNELMTEMSKNMLGPMNVIIGLSEMLQEELGENEKLSELRDAADRLHLMINDSLDFQQIKKGDVQAQELMFDLNQMINDLRGQTENDFLLKVKVNYDLSIPALVIGDKQRLLQLLTSFFHISAKNNENEGVVRISAELIHEDKSTVKVGFTSSLSDTQGSSSGSVNQLFDEKGKGLTRDLINLMGGELSFNSNGDSTKAYFELIFKKAPKSVHQINEPIVHDFKGINVLLVDDLETNRIILGKFLEKWGISYDVAEEGETAIKNALENKYDLILMDLRMPGMDGFEAAKRIKIEKEVPIIALTASLSTFDDEAYHNSAVDDLLVKPFHPHDLKQKIANLLN